jgi:uncharacterized cupredoxin-like copper-binding protein
VGRLVTVFRLPLLSGVASGAAIVVAISGCAPGQSSTSVDAVVRVTERDFHISAPRQVRAGDVLLRVKNRGPDAHELLLIRDDDGRLPFRGDGVTVNEESLKSDEVGVLEPGAPNSLRELQVHLTPGRYVLLCNMSGHYLGGMRATLVVR